MVNKLITAAFILSAVAAYSNADPVTSIDKRVATVSQELRCLVCQNQTIADSEADLAVDLRRQVREQLVAGKSEKEVVQYMTERYGDFVVYSPPIRADTLLLWFGPAILLVAGFGLLALRVRRLPAAAPLTAAEREKADALLKGRREQ